LRIVNILPQDEPIFSSSSDLLNDPSIDATVFAFEFGISEYLFIFILYIKEQSIDYSVDSAYSKNRGFKRSV